MRPKSMILIVIALGCGLVASIGISQVMEGKNAAPAPVAPMEKIYVATADIPLGEILTPKMVKVEEWPQDKVPEGAIRKLEEIEGKRPLTRLFPGEPLMMAKLIDANRFFGASEKIPKGFRVASVRVTMDSSASGLINPGDQVDVLVFLKGGRGISLTGTRTILKNCTVFAVNDRFHRDVDEEGDGSMKAKTVSLLVTPSQVERIMLAQELGKIKLSLRPADDDTNDTANGATIADLDSDSSGDTGFSLADASGEYGSQSGSGGITDFLAGMKAMGSSTADTTMQPSWVMHVHTPESVQVFNWDDTDSLPRELLGKPDPNLPTTSTVPSAGNTFTDSADTDSETSFTSADDFTADGEVTESNETTSLLD